MSIFPQLSSIVTDYIVKLYFQQQKLPLHKKWCFTLEDLQEVGSQILEYLVLIHIHCLLNNRPID